LHRSVRRRNRQAHHERPRLIAALTTIDWIEASRLSAEFGYTDVELGVLKSGKEATVSLVERPLLADGSTVLLARKQYRYNASFTKRDPYLEGSYAHRADIPYAMRVGEIRKARAFAGWRSNEFVVLQRLWHAGASVPFPFEFDEGDVVMEFLGEERVAAPRLETITPSAEQASRWLGSLVDDLHTFVGLLLVHADFSPYNVLIHNDTPYVIDVPQAVPIGQAPNALELLYRDVSNLLDFFGSFTECPSVDGVMRDLMRYAPWRR